VLPYYDLDRMKVSELRREVETLCGSMVQVGTAKS